MSLGNVQVTSHVVGYKLLRANQVVSTHPLDLPPAHLDTRGLWLLRRHGRPGCLSAGWELLGSLHAAEHALIHAMPLLAMCDRGAAGGISTVAHPAVDGPLVLLYDGYPGGSGIVETA